MQAWIRAISFITLSILSTAAYTAEYDMPPIGDDIIGKNYTIKVEAGDSLTTIRQEHGISYDELLVANPDINFYKLKVGQTIFIPKQFVLPKFRKGIVINIPELRLYYFSPDGETVYTYPVGLGRPNWRTPLISAKVIRKKEDPIWNVPKSIREYVYNKSGKLLPEAIYPGPKNPLGKYALYLSKPGYMIHGTNAPTSVGTFISSGCMRLLRGPIETLYEEVPIGTPVHVIHYPNKVGWRGNKLYLESHRPIKSYTSHPSSELVEPNAEAAIYEAVHLRPAKVDWDIVAKNIKQELGVPELIGYRSDIPR